MAIEPVQVEYEYSIIREKDIQVSRLHPDGFLLLKEDPDLWIRSNPGDLLSVRFLEFNSVEKIGDSIGKLSHLTHLAISFGGFECMPNSISSLHNLQHLELFTCCKLQELPADLGDLSSLTFLSLTDCSSIKSLPDGILKLSRLTSLHLDSWELLTELPAISSVVELNLRHCHSIQFLPKGLCSSPSTPGYLHYRHDPGPWIQSNCLLSLFRILDLDSVYVQDLRFKHCFNLIKLLPNVSGTRIESLYDSITKLRNLRYLTLSKCFLHKSLPKNVEDKVRVFDDDTDDMYYQHAGYYDPYYDSIEDNEIAWGCTEAGDEVVSQEFMYNRVIKQASSQSLLSPLYDATQVYEGSYFSSRTVPIDNGFTSSQNLEMGILPTVNEDCVVPLAPNNISSFIETDGHRLPINIWQDRADPTELEDSPFDGRVNTIGKSSSYAHCYIRNQELDISALRNFGESNRYGFQIEQRSAEFHSISFVHGWCDYHALDIGQNHNPQSDNVKDNKTQKKEIPLECILPLMSRNMRLVDAAKQLKVEAPQDSFNSGYLQVTGDLGPLVRILDLEIGNYGYQMKVPDSTGEVPELTHVYFCHGGILSTLISLRITQSNMGSLMTLFQLFTIVEHSFDFKSVPDNYLARILLATPDDDDDGQIEDVVVYEEYLMLEEYIDLIAEQESPLRLIEDVIYEEEYIDLIAEPESPLRLIEDVIYEHHMMNEDCIDWLTEPESPSRQTEDDFIYGHYLKVEECIDWITEPESPPRLNDIFDSTQVPEESRFAGSIDEIGDDIFNPRCVLHQDTESLPSTDDRVETFMDDSVIGSSFSFHVTTFDESNQQANRQNKNSQSDDAKYKQQKIEISEDSILSLLSQKMRLVDAAKQLGVSRSTMKRKLKDFGIKWQSSRQRQDVKNKKHNTKSPYARRNSSLLPNMVDPTDLAGHGLRGGNLAGPSQPTLSDRVPSSCNVLQCSTPESLCPIDGHRRVGEHSNCVKECTLLSTVQPRAISETFTVKATYNDDTVKFKFSSSSSFEQLEEEVGKRLKLKVGTFKLKYLDEENDWILMTSFSDLLDALSVSTSSGSNAVRLSVEVFKSGLQPNLRA